MKTKHEILTALAHSGEEKILLASLLDKEQTCETRGYATSTRFLSMSERALCTEAVHQAGATGHALFWGGYEDAERGIYLFYPDYMDEESARLSAPLALLRAHKSRSDTLTHRDYLGALMGLQIDRSVVGDILVHDEGADIIVLEDVAEFILMNFGKAGRKNLSLTREELSDLRQAVTEEKRGPASTALPRSFSVCRERTRRRASKRDSCSSTTRPASSRSVRSLRATASRCADWGARGSRASAGPAGRAEYFLILFGTCNLVRNL